MLDNQLSKLEEQWKLPQFDWVINRYTNGSVLLCNNSQWGTHNLPPIKDKDEARKLIELLSNYYGVNDA